MMGYIFVLFILGMLFDIFFDKKKNNKYIIYEGGKNLGEKK